MADNPSDGEPIPWELRESEEFLAKAAELMGSVRAWDDVKWSFSWQLVEIDPYSGQYIPTYEIWVVALRTTPRTFVYYNINNDQRYVDLLDIVQF